MENEELTLQSEDVETGEEEELNEGEEATAAEQVDDVEDETDIEEEQPSGNAEGAGPSEDEGAVDGGTPPEIRIPVEFADGTRELSAQEVGEYAKKSAMYDEIAPMWDEICRMAEERQETPQRLIEALARAEEQILYDRLLREANGNKELADKLMKLEKSERKSARETARQQRETAVQSEKQALTDRLAAEFLEVKEEFPEYGEFSQLPKSVVETATNKQIHLMDALLRYQRAESKKIENNNKTKEAAATTSLGSLSDAVPDPNSVDPYLKAMREGFASVW